jgi:hypothetical protein
MHASVSLSHKCSKNDPNCYASDHGFQSNYGVLLRTIWTGPIFVLVAGTKLCSLSRALGIIGLATRRDFGQFSFRITVLAKTHVLIKSDLIIIPRIILSN